MQYTNVLASYMKTDHLNICKKLLLAVHIISYRAIRIRNKEFGYLINFVSSTVTRVVRVISQLRGNMLLVGVGGSGRQSLSKMAASICEYQVFQVEVTKQYRKMEFREGELFTDISKKRHDFYHSLLLSM